MDKRFQINNWGRALAQDNPARRPLEKEVGDFLEAQGFEVIREIDPAQFGVDVLAKKDQKIIAVEVKCLGGRPLSYDSIAQIKHYAQRVQDMYDGEVVPVIVGSFDIAQGVKDVAAKNSVKLIGLPERSSPADLREQLSISLGVKL